MIFYLEVAQNLVAEHHERDSDKIFHLKAAQNMAAEQYESDFHMIFKF